MSDVLGMLATIVALGFRLKESIEKAMDNRDSRREIAARISTSLGKLRSTGNGIKKTASPGLTKAVKKLKQDIEHALTQVNQVPAHGLSVKSQLKQWWQRDTIEAVLTDIEKQITSCFHEFTLLSNIRIEKAIGNNNVQVNKKLDELLRRTNPSPRADTSTSESRRESLSKSSKERPQSIAVSGTTLPKNQRRRSTSWSKPLPQEQERPQSVAVPKDQRRRSTSWSKPLPQEQEQPKSIAIPKDQRRRSTSLNKPSRQEQERPKTTRTLPKDQRHRSTSLNKPLPQEQRRRSHSLTLSTVTSPHPQRRSTDPVISQQPPPVVSEIDRYKEQANDYEDEFKRLKDENLLKEAIFPARKAVALRRRIHSMDPSFRNTAALANSLNNVARCLKGSGSLTGDLLDALAESNNLYGSLFRHDKNGDYRLEYATSLYNLSVSQSEVALANHDTSRLSIAEENAELSVAQFRRLHHHDKRQYANQLVNAYLNLSFILTDLARHEKALAIARRAVEISSGMEDGQEYRHLTQRSLMRVSYCCRNLGKHSDADLAEEQVSIVD